LSYPSCRGHKAKSGIQAEAYHALQNRWALYDAVLIKDNHREVSHPQMSIPEIIACFRKKTKVPIEIEVDTLEQFKHAVIAKPDYILLDNMSLAQMKKAVTLNKKIHPKKRPLLEASGGITLKSTRAVAKTGVDRISVGALTHSHRSINVSMEIT